MKTIALTLTGTRPLLMNSDRSVNVLDPQVREMQRLVVQYKKDRTDASFVAGIDTA